MPHQKNYLHGKELSYRENKICSETSEAMRTTREHAQSDLKKLFWIRITLVRRLQCHWSRRRGKLLVTWDLVASQLSEMLQHGLSQTPWYEVWFINVALSPMGDICFGSTRYYGLWYDISHNICDILQNSHPWSLWLKATLNSIIPLWDLFWMTRVVSQLVLGQNVINFNLLTTKYSVKNSFKSWTHSAATSLQVWSLWWNVEASAFKQFLNLFHSQNPDV